MAAKLVFIFMKSRGRSFPGIWKTSPGDKNANKAAAIRGAAQSFILKSLNSFFSAQLLKDLGGGGGGGGGEWSKAYQKGFGYYFFISSFQLPERG